MKSERLKVKSEQGLTGLERRLRDDFQDAGGAPRISTAKNYLVTGSVIKNVGCAMRTGNGLLTGTNRAQGAPYELFGDRFSDKERRPRRAHRD